MEWISVEAAIASFTGYRANRLAQVEACKSRVWSCRGEGVPGWALPLQISVVPPRTNEIGIRK